ncbi:ribonuclease H-like domain-containing protein [Nemania sp. NC0429]|nr:ribonuclease H-like domain-containing protein [Nemania sp. NC0429]
MRYPSQWIPCTRLLHCYKTSRPPAIATNATTSPRSRKPPRRNMATISPPPPTKEEFLAMLGMSMPEKRRGTGRVFPTQYAPSRVGPTGDPRAEFVGRPGPVNDYMERFTHRDDRSKILIYTDGACFHNGQADAKGAWSFFFGPEPEARTCAGRLENKGPFGDNTEQTSNRAELRAVLAALRARQWSDDGYRTVVIATDSEYVAQGVTDWVRKWVGNGWKTAKGKNVANRDLWELLLGEAERYQECGLAIQFWRIDRSLNHIADAAAAKALTERDDEDYEDFMVPGI